MTRADVGTPISLNAATTPGCEVSSMMASHCDSTLSWSCVGGVAMAPRYTPKLDGLGGNGRGGDLKALLALSSCSRRETARGSDWAWALLCGKN
jgi:hypothetical protein